MINHPAFEFLVDKENSSIRIKRKFDAEVPLVWEAFTDKEILDQWWAPKPWQSRTKSMDFREGGRRLYAMVGPAGEEHWAIFDYYKIKTPHFFSGLDGFSDSNGVLSPGMPRMDWEVNFKEDQNKTLVDILVKFEDFSQLEKIIEMGFREGFAMALDSLDELLATAEKKA